MRTETPSIARTGREVEFLRGYENLKQWLYSVAVIVSFSVFVAFSKGYLRVPLHVPGHSAIYVIPLLLLGRLASRNRLGGMGIGCLSGGMMAFLGIGGGFLLAIPRYFLMGAIIDVLLWREGTQKSMAILVAAGAFANAAKFFIGMVIATLVGIPAFFIQIGMTYSLVTHLVFGAVGGIIAFGILKLIRRVQKSMERESRA